MKVAVKLFGEFREAAGRERIELDLPAGTTCGQALLELAGREPRLAGLLFQEQALRDHLHVFVNGRNVAHLQGLDTELREGQALTFFPPLGGG